MELFVDTGNAFQQAYRSKAYLPVVSGVPAIEGPFDSVAGTKFGASSPAVFLDDTNKVKGALKSRMDSRHTTNLEGAPRVTGLRPGLVGYLLGSLTIPTWDSGPNRTAIALNACIRGTMIDRESNATTLFLNGF
jgi:hypothetical protein